MKIITPSNLLRPTVYKKMNILKPPDITTLKIVLLMGNPQSNTRGVLLDSKPTSDEIRSPTRTSKRIYTGSNKNLIYSHQEGVC